jgi:hypothetical protein
VFSAYEIPQKKESDTVKTTAKRSTLAAKNDNARPANVLASIWVPALTYLRCWKKMKPGTGSCI